MGESLQNIYNILFRNKLNYHVPPQPIQWWHCEIYGNRLPISNLSEEKQLIKV